MPNRGFEIVKFLADKELDTPDNGSRAPISYTASTNNIGNLHNSHSEPELIGHRVIKRLLHSSSESLVSRMNSSGSDTYDTSVGVHNLGR